MRDWLFLSRKSELDFWVRHRKPRPDEVLSVVADLAGVPVKALKRRDARFAVSHTRQLAMLLMRENCHRNSYEAIAQAVGKKDHTTTLYGCRAAARRVAEDPAYQALYLAAAARLERRGAS